MKIAILSGKGGTGKTTIAINLAFVNKNGILIDTDVEEPNSHLFLKPNITKIDNIMKSHPVVDMSKCDLCGACGDFCRYNSIIPAKNDVLIFKEMCHDCGGCKLVCPKDAISYEDDIIGEIHSGQTKDGITMKYGDLKVGSVSGVKIIKSLKSQTKDESLVFIDCPPGTSCATVAAIEDVDYAIIVSEPTPFGVSDMKMVVELLRNMNTKFGVVVNKADLGDDEIYRFCELEDIEILENISFDEKFAKLYASGKILAAESNVYKNQIENILNKIL